MRCGQTEWLKVGNISDCLRCGLEIFKLSLVNSGHSENWDGYFWMIALFQSIENTSFPFRWLLKQKYVFFGKRYPRQ